MSILLTPEEAASGSREQDLIRARDEGYSRYAAWHVRRDGRRIWAEVSLWPLRRAGQPLGYGMMLRDVTVELRAAEALRARTCALEQMNEHKDAVLAMISHELRNPLAAMMNALAIIRHEKPTDPFQLRARDIMDRQARHLVGLVCDLAEASRLRAGKLQLHKERMDVRRAVQSAVETCRPLVDQRGHTLQVSLPTHSVWVHADASRLEQVFVNLVTNAAKYTRDGGHIDVSLVADANESVARVSDTGIGIAPEMIDRIFELFTQASHGAQGGLGVGLAVVRSLISMHEGTIAAHSDGIGKGSVFTVRLPLAD